MAARSDRRGVTLFRDLNFRGEEEWFDADDSKLSDNQIGNDSVSSLRVDRGCKAVLYTDNRFGGQVFATEQDIPSMARTPIGNDSVSSIQVQCRR